MANTIGEGSIYKSASRGWTGALKDKRTGKRKYFYGKTRAIVKEKMQDYLDTYQLSDEKVSNDTVEHFFNSWLEELKKTIKPKSYDAKKYIINRFIIPELKYIKVGDITPRDIQALINKVTKEGYSYSVVQKIYNNLNQRFKLAVDQRELLFNPVVGIHLPKLDRKPRSEIRWFLKEELSAILEEAERKFSNGTPVYKHGYAIRLLAYTGMRAGEALALTWDDIDFDNKKIAVTKNIVTAETANGVRLIEQSTPKTNSSNRVIPMSECAKIALLGLKSVQKQEYDHVISTDNNTPVYVKNLARMFKNIQKNARIQPMGTLHSIRHTFATRLLAVGEDVKVVSQLLGHSDIGITYDTYIHVIQEQKVKAIEKIDMI